MKTYTINTTRELAKKVEQQLQNGRKVLVPSRGGYVEQDGKYYSCYVQFVGGKMETTTKVFNSRKEVCEFLSSLIF